MSAQKITTNSTNSAKSVQNKPGICQPVQNAIFGNMERFYNWFGMKVAAYPFWIILASLLICGGCSAGFMLLESETDQLELWVPTDSDFYRNNKWLGQTFPSTTRAQSILLVTKDKSNILTKANLDIWRDILKKAAAIT